MSGPTKQFRNELDEEVSKILAQEFVINVTGTKYVPHYNDNAITFPNLDAKRQDCKLVETCVLYVDIRRSTELNLTHRPVTVAKLYSAFVRAMTRCATERGGHVRGIIGDRLMVLFDSENAFQAAVETAISMHSTATYIIDKHFKHNEVKCGIGIDSGKMLATKTGFRRHGAEQQNYRSLVWLGRPANVASKLTDIANKPEETYPLPKLDVLRWDAGLQQMRYVEEDWATVMRGFQFSFLGGWSHVDQSIYGYWVSQKTVVTRAATPPILMTKNVYDGYKMARPMSPDILNNWFKIVNVAVPGYSGFVYGGDVFWDNFP